MASYVLLLLVMLAVVLGIPLNLLFSLVASPWVTILFFIVLVGENYLSSPFFVLILFSRGLQFVGVVHLHIYLKEFLMS